MLDCAIVHEGALPQDLVERCLAEGASLVKADLEACRALVPRVLDEPLAHAGSLVRHDPDRLARAIVEAASLKQESD